MASARVELRQKAERAARRLSRDPRVALVFLFGSVEAPGSSPPGDLDLGVWTQPALGLDELMRLRADLALEFQAPIDLVSLNDASVVLAYEVAESGRCLFARTPDAETEFVVRARARFWDFRPYREEQWRLTAERLEERRLGP